MTSPAEPADPADSEAPVDAPDPNRDERLYDEYLDAALRGEAEDPDAFCAARGISGDGVRALLDGVHRLLVPGDRDATGLPGARRAGAVPFETLGDFSLLRQLGEGGMGTVYLAEQRSLQRLAAVKVIRPELAGSLTAEVRLRQEAQAIARLRHPNIVTIYSFGHDQGVWYLAMELVRGRNLDAALEPAENATGPRPFRRLVDWIAQIADALHHAHGEGILHRDVKPSNILVPSDDKAMLLDFGLARDLTAATPTVTKTFAGSPTYASPEQLTRERAAVDHRTDIYSLGVTLYEGVTGRPPHAAESMQKLLHRVLVEEPTPPRRLNPDVPRDLQTVVMEAIEKSPEHRYATAADFAADLRAVLELRPIQARPPGRLVRLTKWTRRHRALSAATAAAVLAAIALVSAFTWNAHLDNARRQRDAEQLIEDARTLIRDSIDRRLAASREEPKAGALIEASQTRWLKPEEDELVRRYRRSALDYWTRSHYVLAQVRDRLSRARELSPGGLEVDDVWAEFYLEKWWEYRWSKEFSSLAQVFRDLVYDFDSTGQWIEKLESQTRVTLTTDPPGAEVFLFRYRDQRELDDESDSRLVPCPRSAATPALTPGTSTLRVVRGRADLRPGDLITQLAGQPIGQPPLPGSIEIAERGGIQATVWQDGERQQRELPHGLVVRPTVAPLPLSPACRIGVTPLEVTLPAAEYIAVLRLADHETLRLPFPITNVAADIRGPVEVQARLLPTGTTPPGFVRLCHPHRDDDWLWFMEREVTQAEFQSFQNDSRAGQPATAATTAGRKPATGMNYAQACAYAVWKNEAGRVHLDGREFEYRLPLMIEFRWAGGAVGIWQQPRRYVFGDQFHTKWVNSRFSRQTTGPEPAFSYPLDESIYGAYDLAGNVAEWCYGFVDEARLHHAVAGGSWNAIEATAFQTRSFASRDPAATASTIGFRLVLTSLTADKLRK